MKLTAVEWRVIAIIMAEGPISAWQIAKTLKLKYPHAKRAARELARWGMVVRSEDGLQFHTHPEDWKRTQSVANMNALRHRPSPAGPPAP